PDHVAEAVQAQVAGGALQLAVGGRGQAFQVGADAPRVVAEGEQARGRTARGRHHVRRVRGRRQADGAAAGPGFGRERDAVQDLVLVGLAGARAQVRGGYAGARGEAGQRQLRRQRTRLRPTQRQEYRIGTGGRGLDQGRGQVAGL